MSRTSVQTLLIITESIVIIVLASWFGWYYYHVQNSLQYAGDPLYGPNGYQTEWIIGTSSSNITASIGQHPTANITLHFSVQARQLNSYMVIVYAPCAKWLYENISGPRPPTCAAPASMSMYIFQGGACFSPIAKNPIRESYSVQYHSPSNVLYESGNITTPTVTSARFPASAGDNCILISNTGQTDLVVMVNAKIQFTTV